MLFEKYDEREEKTRPKHYDVPKKSNRYFSLPEYYGTVLYDIAKTHSGQLQTTKAGISNLVIAALNSKRQSNPYIFPKNIPLIKIKIYIPDFLYSSVKTYARRLDISASRFIAYNVISYIDEMCNARDILTPHETYLLECWKR